MDFGHEIGNEHRSRLGLLIGREMPELQLSEAFAYTLGVCPAAAHSLLGEWTEAETACSASTTVNIETEQRVMIPVSPDESSARRIDLAMSRDGESPATVWVEIKWGLRTESSEGQVLGYANHLERTLGGSGRSLGVVYLTDVHASRLDSSEFPDDVKYSERTWRELFDALREFKDDPAVADFRRYLEEVGLALSAIDDEDIRMLAKSRGSRRRMEQILEMAHGRIAALCLAEHGIKPEQPRPKFKTWVAEWGNAVTYANCSLPDTFSPAVRESFLIEWNLRSREGLDQYEDGEVLLAAGLTWLAEEEDAPFERARVIQGLQDGGEDHFVEYQDDLRRVYRFLSPADLIGDGRSIHDQAEALIGFVMDTYGAILDVLPEVDWGDTQRRR